MNIVGLSSTTNPYIQARWSAFSENNSDYVLSHIEFGRVSSVYDWKPTETKVPYTREILSDGPSQYQSIPQLFKLIRSLIERLNRIQPDALVLNGYQQPTTLAALAWTKLHRKPAILLSESKEDDAPRKWLTETIKKALISNYQSALVGGKKHKDYLVKLGLKEDAIFLGYNIIGNQDYHPNKLAHLSHPSKLQKPYFLAINRFITKKNIPTIIKAYAEYRQKQPSEPWDLVLCGDGELRPQIESQIQSLHLESSIHLTGFLQPKELLPYFAYASCFIHASIQEQWGLVVNEAMAAGLPAIVSNLCGCFDELVIEGKTGFGFDPTKPSELANFMFKVSSPDFDINSMKESALEHIAKFGPNLFANGLHKAIQYALVQKA
ncbi:glycosyltransferase family 4 protein [Leptothoe sp. EHU-05/26/07-4]